MSLINKYNSSKFPQKRGSNVSAVRSYNERLILQLVRERGELSKAEATLATGLSANAISVIFRALETENLLLRGEPIRGRVGQPSTPLRINEKFRHYLTLRIARRVLELAVIDFSGKILSIARSIHSFPTPEITMAFVKKNAPKVLCKAGIDQSDIDSVGVAMPYELWHWTDEFSAPTNKMNEWRTFDLRAALKHRFQSPVLIENDATAACRAELAFGKHYEKEDWIYFYIDTFIGGGIVLNGSVFPGRRGNAGGFGPMRVPSHNERNRLVDHASLVVLEKKLIASQIDPLLIYQEQSSWEQFEPALSQWVTGAATSLSHAIISSLAVMDFEAVIIEGMFPSEVKNSLVSEVKSCFQNTDLQGVFIPEIEPGQIGENAQTIGAAASIVSKDYLIDHNTLNRG